MSDIFETQDEVNIRAENFLIDHQDHTHINSRLNYLSDLAPLNSQINLNLVLKDDKYIGSLKVKNIAITFSTLVNASSVAEVFSKLDSETHHKIITWKRNRFKDNCEDKLASEALEINLPEVK